MLGRIAIYLGRDAGLEHRLRAAIQLAAEHKAEIIGVYPGDLAHEQVYDQPAMPDEVYHIMNSRFAADRAEVKALFFDRTQAAGITVQWRTPQGPLDESLAVHARYCDLLVMSKAEASDAGATQATPAKSVIMSAGRPVLMIPSSAGTLASIGQRILFCWDRRREAARAFADAAPFLQACSRLVVLTVDPNTEDMTSKNISDNDFAAYCASLGYPKPEEITIESHDIGVGNCILNSATDHASDLIVMGAYGHSRMRQWIMGGASRTLLSSMTVPVLLSH